MARLEEGRVVCTPVSGHHVSRCRVVEESEGSMSAGGHVFVLLRFRKWGWECGSRNFFIVRLDVHNRWQNRPFKECDGVMMAGGYINTVIESKK